MERSVDIVATTKSPESTLLGVRKLTENGFNVRGKVANEGACLYVFGIPMIRDVPGTLTVRGTYAEERIAD